MEPAPATRPRPKPRNLIASGKEARTFTVKTETIESFTAHEAMGHPPSLISFSHDRYPSDRRRIKAKIAKLLRMQASSNENEAANAALLVEKLCRQHGISSTEISADFDPDKDQAIAWDALAYGKRRDAAEVMLLSYVATFFNGQCISKCRKGQNTIEVIATQASRLNPFRVPSRDDGQADRAKAAEDPFKLDRSFRQNFRKAFVDSIGRRLYEIRRDQRQQEQEAEQMPRPAGTSAPGLVAQKRRNIEQQAVDQSCIQRDPGTGARGSGSQHGKAAGARLA